MKLHSLLGRLIILASLVIVSAAHAEDGRKPKISTLPFKTCHIVYKITSADSVSAEKKIVGLWELFIDVPNNRLAFSKKFEPSKKSIKQENLWARKIFRDGEWLELGSSRSEKYLRVPAQIDPLLEEFNSHYCAPYPSIKKLIQGRESVGCKRRDRFRETEQYFWNNILMEETAKERFRGAVSTTAIVSLKTDVPIDEAVFKVAPELIADEAEVYAELRNAIAKRGTAATSAGQRLRIEALAAVDSKYADLFPAKDAKSGDIDWKSVYARADTLDREWAKSLGWVVEPSQSMSDFISARERENAGASDYHEKLYRSALYASNEASERPLNELSAAIKKNPYDADLFSQRASFYAKVSKYQEALQDANESIRRSIQWMLLDRSVKEAVYQRAAIFCRLDRCEEATRDITLVIQHEERRRQIRQPDQQMLAKKSGENKAVAIPQARDLQLAGYYGARGDINFHCKRDKDALTDYQSGLNVIAVSDPTDPQWNSGIERVRRALLLKAAYLSGRVNKALDGLKLLQQFVTTLNYDEDRGKFFEKDANYIRFYLHRQLKQQQEIMQDLELIGGDELVGKYLHIQAGLILLRKYEGDKIPSAFVCWLGSEMKQRDFQSEVFRDDFVEIKHHLDRFTGRNDCVDKARAQIDGMQRSFSSLKMTCP